MNPERMFLSTPVIKLGDHFKKVRLAFLGELWYSMSCQEHLLIVSLHCSHVILGRSIPETIQNDPRDA